MRTQIKLQHLRLVIEEAAMVNATNENVYDLQSDFQPYKRIITIWNQYILRVYMLLEQTQQINAVI